MKVFVAGSGGMVGKSVIEILSKDKKYEVYGPSSKELNLLDQKKTFEYFERNSFDCVILCAAKVGGILANSSYKKDFLSKNIFISFNTIESAEKTGVKKFINLGSSCIYPKDCKTPINENQLLSGPLEGTNDAYAIAKIAALKYCEYINNEKNLKYLSLMPCNLYGPHDNFSLKGSHVIPALIRKFHHAKTHNDSSVEVWGSGKPLREFMYVEDVANAVELFLKKIDDASQAIYNIGPSNEISIKNLAILISKIVGFKGRVVFNEKYPDGVFSKKMDSMKANAFGWKAEISLEMGLRMTYEWYLDNIDSARK